MKGFRTEDTVILALDILDQEKIIGMAESIGHRVYAIKIHVAFDKFGWRIIDRLKSAGVKRVWVDHKLHDKPDIAKLRARELQSAGADIVSVHASGGIEMLKQSKLNGLKIYAVTALTSMSENEIFSIYGKSAEAASLQLSQNAFLSGADGIVCSAREVGILSKIPKQLNTEFICPGVRSLGANHHDQKRVNTPANALMAGATKLVIGRQITEGSDPVSAFERLSMEIADIGRSV